MFERVEKRHALGGTHFCTHARDRNSLVAVPCFCGGRRGALAKDRPLSSCAWPIFPAGRRCALAKIGALRQTQLPVSSTGRGRCVCPWGQNLPQNRALSLAASHTLCGKFPCRCPSRTHMSSGWDFFDRMFSVWRITGPGPGVFRLFGVRRLRRWRQPRCRRWKRPHCWRRLRCWRPRWTPLHWMRPRWKRNCWNRRWG